MRKESAPVNLGPKKSMSSPSPTTEEKPGTARAMPQRRPVRERLHWPINALWLRTLISMGLMLIFLLLGVAVFHALSGFKADPPRETRPAPVLRVEAFVAERTDLRRFLSGFGTVRPDREVVVSAEVAGRITQTENLKVGKGVTGPEITVTEEGRSLRRSGDVIVRIDPQTYQERVAQASALVEQDRIALDRLEREHATNERLLKQQEERLATIQAELERFERLLADGAGRETDVQRTRLEVEQYRETKIRLQNDIELYPIRRQELESRLASHRNDLNLAELDLEKAAVSAPFPGVLSEVFIEAGQYVRPGDALFQVTALDVVEVPVPVAADDADQMEQLIALGRYPRAELARNADHFAQSGATVWTGIVRRMSPVADERTRTLMAFVEVDNAEQPVPLKPGTFTYTRLEAGTLPASQGVLVPRDAIVNGEVFLVRDRETVPEEEPDGNEAASPAAFMIARRQPVSISKVMQTFALLEEGVEAGDRIVVTNLDIIGDGMAVDVQKNRTLDDEFARIRVPYLERFQDAD
jgi:RND family efflux transporter MFP subunit